MSCADVCIDMDCSDGSADFIVQSVRTARKPHKCCECSRVIQIGERYYYTSGKNDGAVWSEKMCAECDAIKGVLVCGGFYFGHLWEEIENAVFPAWLEIGPYDCLAKIDSLSAREKLRAAFNDWREHR